MKAAAEIEASLHTTSRLKNCQNEEKLSVSCGPVMRKTPHDGLSSGSLKLTDMDNCSKNKLLMSSKIIYSDADNFTITGKPF